MSKNLNEITKIVSKTRPNGEVDFELMDQDVATKLNGTTVDDGKGNRVKIKDTGKTLTEEETINTGDFINLGKSLNAAVESALRQHGDEIAYTKPKANIGKNHISIYVYYKNDSENLGRPSEDKFTFRIENNNIKLQNGSDTIDVCPVIKKAGTLYINRDLAKDAILSFIGSSSENVESTETLGEQDSLEKPDKDLLLGFKKAVDEYKLNKNKDTIKELFKASRGFAGDTLSEKFKNAVKAYLSNGVALDSGEEAITDEPQTVSPQDSRVETEPEECTCVNDEGNLCLDMSLFIRLMEYAREDAKEDVDLHFVAENLQDVCKSKGCATMRDYELIISAQSGEDRESDAVKPEEVDEGYLDSAIIGKVDPEYDTYLAFCEENDLDPNLDSSREEYEFAKENGDLEVDEHSYGFDKELDEIDFVEPENL